MTDHTHKTIADVCQLEQMTEAEQQSFFARLSTVILDAALSRLLVSLDEPAVARLQEYLEGAGETEDVLGYLLKEYPDFETFLTEEATALQEEAVATFTK